MFIKYKYTNNLGKESEGFISLSKVASFHFSKDGEDKEMLLITLPFSTHDYRDVNTATKGTKIERKLMQIPYTIFVADPDTIAKVKAHLESTTL